MRVVRSILATSMLLSIPLFLAACGGSGSKGTQGPQQTLSCRVEAVGLCLQVSGTWSTAQLDNLNSYCAQGGTPADAACPSDERLHGYCALPDTFVTVGPENNVPVASIVEYFYAPASLENATAMCTEGEGTWHAYPQQKVACSGSGYCFELSGTWTAQQQAELMTHCTTDVKATPSVGACPSTGRLYGYCVLNPVEVGAAAYVQSMVEYFYAPMPSAAVAESACLGTWHAY